MGTRVGGGLAGCSGPGEGGSGTPSRATHRPACTPCSTAITWLMCHVHHAVCTAPVKPRRTLSSTPQKGGSPPVSTAWRTQPSSKAHPLSSSDAEKLGESRGGPGGAWTLPQTPASFLCYWARGLATPGRKDEQTTARASNSFCLELDSSVLADGKWFSIESIIFFSLNIYLLKLYFFVSLGKSASAHSQ